MYEFIGQTIGFSSVRWTWTPSNPSLNFEVNDRNGNIVINQHGTFFIYAQVRTVVVIVAVVVVVVVVLTLTLLITDCGICDRRRHHLLTKPCMYEVSDLLKTTSIEEI